ncbi:hypothetical protein Y032_0082g1588 [Ancylostoma ceylanicum]|uniref:Uncharacterized protein n=1 Tax=Ancylostoma ceylanicum TaxID=53326 RepID=A0A016TRS4_9BILA|nr:hypothetical protein Y032_0082g1588 [Ancylostoma ceylanicum]
MPLSYGPKFDDVNAVFKALVEAITRRPVQCLGGGSLFYNLRRHLRNEHDEKAEQVDPIRLSSCISQWLKTTLFTQDALKLDAGGDQYSSVFA